MPKRVLMIAFHYPPSNASSGHLRTLAFSRYLARYEWEPIVLTVDPRVYPSTDINSNALLPDKVLVHRAFSLELRKYFSLKKYQPGILSVPDPWASWRWWAVPAGMDLIKRMQPDIIWSTYPISTSHRIANTLAQRSGLPWVADFRDPLGSGNQGTSIFARFLRKHIDSNAANNCRFATFTTPGAVQIYRTRYSHVDPKKWIYLPNGYDEDDFRDIPRNATRAVSTCIHLIHSGLLYKDGRNPLPFFTAVQNLLAKGRISETTLQITLRGAGSGTYYKGLISELGISSIVKLAETIPYREALIELSQADGLLLFQGSLFASQIPAKVYEYLRIGKQIITFTSPGSDTEKVMRETGFTSIADIDNPDHIEQILQNAIELIRSGNTHIVPSDKVCMYSRMEQTRQLAELFDTVTAK